MCRYGVGELRRGTKSIAAPLVLTTDFTAAVCSVRIVYYAVGAPETLFQLTRWQLICLLFCGLNALIGYGALTEVLARWQAAR